MMSEDKAQRKSGASGRSERLEAALKANLKKRKDQARARASSGETKRSAAPAGEDDTSGS
jgi:hypothetical protein